MGADECQVDADCGDPNAICVTVSCCSNHCYTRDGCPNPAAARRMFRMGKRQEVVGVNAYDRKAVAKLGLIGVSKA